MSSSLAIGDFSRATHLTVKTLRHYHETGLFEPAQIDPQTGYRRYTTEQIPVAQIIKRFRDLDMPLNEIRAVLSAPNVQARNDLIAAHLKRLENYPLNSPPSCTRAHLPTSILPMVPWPPMSRTMRWLSGDRYASATWWRP